MTKVNQSLQNGKQNAEIISVQVSKDITVHLRPDAAHIFLMTSKEVAEGFGISDSVLRSHKSNHPDEFINGKHFISVHNIDAAGFNKTMWTKRGIIRLSMFIKSWQAKQMRDWAEDVAYEALVKGEQAALESQATPSVKNRKGLDTTALQLKMLDLMTGNKVYSQPERRFFKQVKMLCQEHEQLKSQLTASLAPALIQGRLFN